MNYKLFEIPTSRYFKELHTDIIFVGIQPIADFLDLHPRGQNRPYFRFMTEKTFTFSLKTKKLKNIKLLSS